MNNSNIKDLYLSSTKSYCKLHVGSRKERVLGWSKPLHAVSSCLEHIVNSIHWFMFYDFYRDVFSIYYLLSFRQAVLFSK